MTRPLPLSRLCACIFALLITSSAWGQVVLPGPPTPSGNLSFTPSAIVNVIDSGAKCDGATDDASAINTAITKAKAITTGNDSTSGVILDFPATKICVIRSTLNFTGINVHGFQVRGGHLECSTSGAPCIDALSSRYIKWTDLNIWGTAANTPNVGVQIGRISATNADTMEFDHPIIDGSFTLTPFYNFASEDAIFVSPWFKNWLSPGTGAYALIQDGCNHFNITSAFVTQTIAQGQCQSFNENLFVGGQFITAGTNPPIWLGNTTRHRFKAAYATGGAAYDIVLYTDTTGLAANIENEYDIHSEGGSITSVFLIAGSTATPTIKGLRYTEHRAQGTASVFAADTTAAVGTSSITGVTMVDADIHVGSTTGTPTLFDNSALYTVSGSVYLPQQSAWTEPASFSGMVCVTVTCTPYVPTLPINRNPDFVLDQINEGAAFLAGASSTLVDGWRAQLAGGLAANKLTYQKTATAVSGYPNSLKVLVSTTVVPAAGTLQTPTSTIEGTDFSAAAFGTAVAKSLSFDFCATANNAGTYNAFLQNLPTGATRSYVITFTLASANVAQCFHNIVPGDTTGSWLSTPNSPGLTIGFGLLVGSTFQTTAGSWQAGQFAGTSGAFAFSNTAAATINIAGVHVRITPFLLPYQARPLNDEYVLAKHWYQKSFAQGVKPAQNAGAVGAVTFLSPYAQATFGTAGVPVQFDPPMYRNLGSTNPFMTFYSTSATTANCYDSTRAADAGAAAAVNLGDSGFLLSCPLVAGDLIGDQLQVQWTADSAF